MPISLSTNLTAVHFYPGQSIGDYAVVELISGSGTAVYRVKHALTEREEAIKVVYGAGQGSIRDSQQFLEEIRLQARLRHPHITEVITAFWADDDLVMVTELPEGKPLRSVLADGPLAPWEAVEIIRQTLEALRHSHHQQVIHRSVSPDSILYSPGRRFAKLTDFGLARARADQDRDGSHSMGVPIELMRYSAPELLRGQAKPDSRADIYSCGATLYELLTAHAPYESTSDSTLLLAMERQVLTAPTKLNPQLPPIADAILKKAMKFWPDERYASAEEFLLALQPLAKALGGAERTARAATRPPSHTGHSAMAQRIALGSGLILTCGIAYFQIPGSVGDEQIPRPVAPKYAILPPALLSPVQEPQAPVSPPPLEIASAPSTPPPAQKPRSKPSVAFNSPAQVVPVGDKQPEAPPALQVQPSPVSAPAPTDSIPSDTAVGETAAAAVIQPEVAGSKSGLVSRVGSGLRRLNPFRKRNKDSEANQASPTNNTLH